jgi:hypothetical protein
MDRRGFLKAITAVATHGTSAPNIGLLSLTRDLSGAALSKSFLAGALNLLDKGWSFRRTAVPLPEFIMGRKIIWGTTLHPEDNRWVITTDSLSADELRVFSQGFDSRADAAIRALQEVFTARDALLGNPQIKQALEAVRGKCGEINRAAKEQLIKDSEKLLAQWKGASNTAIPGHFFPLDLIRSLPCPDSCLALTSPEWQGALAWFELCFKALDDSREGKSDRLNRWNEVLYKLDECLDLGIESAQACLISELGVSSEDALRLNNIFGAKRTTLFECMFSDLMIAAPVSIEEQLGFPDPVLRGALFDLDPACYQETILQK